MMKCVNCRSTEGVTASFDVGVGPSPRSVLYFAANDTSAQIKTIALCKVCWEVVRLAILDGLDKRARELGLPRQMPEELQALLDGVYARGGVPDFLSPDFEKEEPLEEGEEEPLEEGDDEESLE